jgi:hypothetical protein
VAKTNLASPNLARSTAFRAFITPIILTTEEGRVEWEKVVHFVVSPWSQVAERGLASGKSTVGSHDLCIDPGAIGPGEK